jgi:phosphoglycerol geranylgeranyltransferase
MKFEELIEKLKTSGKPKLAVLIDPDKYNDDLPQSANPDKVFCFLVGGTRLKENNIEDIVNRIKRVTKIPVVLFPGDETQLCSNADGLFLPSLLSGRNPEYLIEKQIKMAPLIHKMKLKCVPMAYLLVGGNKISSTQKITGTKPLSVANKQLIINTALAAQQLGFTLLYLEAGSGAKTQVPKALIKQVKKAISIPVIAGGGIDTKQKIKEAIASGADMVVIGNALEKNVFLLKELASCFADL